MFVGNIFLDCSQAVIIRYDKMSLPINGAFDEHGIIRVRAPRELCLRFNRLSFNQSSGRHFEREARIFPFPDGHPVSNN